ncbi:hypothetical protein KVV02_007182 [Mortierella alpina]|uniref:Uncharacterized protein n=1 Tax=Mortierella alpina TaxID=64518 RepID=A0A9P8CZN5_MORAP|nr:hypothetical protein KVV02_007182 [Mortierella alpina]
MKMAFDVLTCPWSRDTRTVTCSSPKLSSLCRTVLSLASPGPLHALISVWVIPIQAMAYIPDIPDLPRQAHLILELVYESLVRLQQQPQQQTQDLHASSSTPGISSNTLLLPSSQAICDAILTLKDRGILLGIQDFLDRTFSSLRYQIELLIKDSGVDLRPQLAIMDRVVNACYHASTNYRGGLCTLDLESIILERTLVDLLHPIWANLHSNSQRNNNIGDHSETSRRINVLLQGEHGIIDRALQAIHASASPQNSATCRAFIMTMIEYSGIFHCRDPAAASVLSGDLIPSADVLSQLSSNVL